MTEQNPQYREQLIESQNVGIEMDLAPNGNMVLSLDPNKVVGLAIVVNVEGLDGIPDGIKYAHNTRLTQGVDHKAFCEFLAHALQHESKGLDQ